MSDGLRIANDLNVFLDPGVKLRMLGSKILVEPLGWNPSAILQVVYTGKTLRGEVQAVGPGDYQKKYDGPKGRRTKSWYSKNFVPTQVKPGDIVELGGLELRGYLFPTVYIGMVEHVICDEADVAGVWTWQDHQPEPSSSPRSRDPNLSLASPATLQLLKSR